MLTLDGTAIVACVLALAIAGCAAEKPASPKPELAVGYPVSVKGVYPVKVNGVFRVTFPNGVVALVMNYETDIPIADTQALNAEVARVWEIFRKDAEEAGVTSAVIRAAHFEGTGPVRQGQLYGFVFDRGSDGQWRRFVRQ